MKESPFAHLSPAQGNCYLLFGDGACSGNPGPGGWGAVLVSPALQVREIGGAEKPTTNNRMELTAMIEALALLDVKRTEPIFVYTDSVYVINGITKWIWGWKRNAWKNGEGKDVANPELWQRLDRVVSPLRARLDWRYARGHVGIPGNERCDEIAVARSKGQFIELYEGPLLRYHVPIFDVPEDHSVPERKADAPEKKKAVAYLSYVDGKATLHQTWPRCEARVKGRPGAKFKKLLSLDEQAEILKGWGLSPTITVVKE